MPIPTRRHVKSSPIPEPPLIGAPKPIITKNMIFAPDKHESDLDIAIATGNVDGKLATPPDRDAELANYAEIDHGFAFAIAGQMNLSRSGSRFHKQSPF